MDEQDSARLNYENLVKRINKLLDDYIMLIDTITGLREKMYTLIAQMCQNPNQNNQVSNEKNDQEKEKIKSMTNQPLRQFSASSSYHVDYQYLQTNFDIHNEKIDQQFIKDIAKDFWKLYLKFSLLDGNRVQHMFIKAKALGYNTDEVIEKRDILRKYFSDQNQLDEAQKLAQAQNANLILNNAANNNNNSTNNNLNNSASYNNNNNNNNHNTSISQSSHSSIQQI